MRYWNLKKQKKKEIEDMIKLYSLHFMGHRQVAFYAAKDYCTPEYMDIVFKSFCGKELQLVIVIGQY